jgi:hypothetical protein
VATETDSVACRLLIRCRCSRNFRAGQGALCGETVTAAATYGRTRQHRRLNFSRPYICRFVTHAACRRAAKKGDACLIKGSGDPKRCIEIYMAHFTELDGHNKTVCLWECYLVSHLPFWPPIIRERLCRPLPSRLDSAQAKRPPQKSWSKRVTRSTTRSGSRTPTTMKDA